MESPEKASSHTAELAVMGVLPRYHRQGVGKALFEAFRQYARAEGYCASYDGTNAFYKSLGFRELECFPTLWDEENPCQIYVMAI